MGMGAIPCHAWTISLDGLREICPRELDDCGAALQRCNQDWGSFAQGMEVGQFSGIPDGAEPEEMENAWKALQEAFKRATSIGESHLELDIGYYAADDGDRYDDLEDGCYFTVTGVTQLTPAGERFKAHLEEKSWTVFG